MNRTIAKESEYFVRKVTGIEPWQEAIRKPSRCSTTENETAFESLPKIGRFEFYFSSFPFDLTPYKAFDLDAVFSTLRAPNAPNAQQGARANATICHASC